MQMLFIKHLRCSKSKFWKLFKGRKYSTCRTK